MDHQHVKLDLADFVATVTLDRPPVNAFNRAIRQEVVETFDALHDRDDVRVVEREVVAQPPCRARGDDALRAERPGRGAKIARRERAAIDEHAQLGLAQSRLLDQLGNGNRTGVVEHERGCRFESHQAEFLRAVR